MIGMLRLRRVDRIVQVICEKEKGRGSRLSLLRLPASLTYLEDDVAEVLLVAVQRMDQLQRLADERERRLALGEDQIQGDLLVGVTVDRELRGRRALADDCGKKIKFSVSNFLFLNS